MKIYKPNVSLHMRKAYQVKDAFTSKTEHSIKLCIFYKGERRFYPTTLKFTDEDWNRIFDPKKNNTSVGKPLKAKHDAVLLKAEKVVEEMEAEQVPFEFDTFKKRYFGFKEANTEFHAVFKARFEELEKKHWKNAVTYRTAYHSFQLFKNRKNNPLKWSDITVEELRKWQDWLEAGGGDQGKKKKKIKPRSKTTIGIYARNIRAIWRIGIDKGYVKESLYPFGSTRDKFDIPVGNNVPAPLTPKEVYALTHYKPATEQEKAGKHWWLFSFYCSGVNPKDICLLQWKNVTDEKIFFQRAKTKTTIKKRPIITIVRTPKINEILDMYCNKDRSPDNFVFKILNERFYKTERKAKDGNPANVKSKVKDGEMDKRISNLIDQYSRNVNDWLVPVLKGAKIKRKVRFYDARDTWATMMRDIGVQPLFIQEQLGHMKFETTQNYLGRMPDQKQVDNSNLLMEAIELAGKAATA